MEKGELDFVTQLINILRESQIKLEKFYLTKDVEKFNEMKRYILSIQKKIDGELE